jgi:hypothetical protein
MSEEDIKLRYIESIKPRLRFEVNAKDIESNLTLEEAMVVAVNFENLTSERTFAEVNTFYNKSNNRYQKIIVCYIMFHMFKLKRNFTFCDVTGNMATWDNSIDCEPPNLDWTHMVNSSYFVLSKMHDVVNGDGFQCYKTRHRFEFHESIFFERHETYSVSIVKLKRLQCQKLLGFIVELHSVLSSLILIMFLLR